MSHSKPPSGQWLGRLRPRSRTSNAAKAVPALQADTNRVPRTHPSAIDPQQTFAAPIQFNCDLLSLIKDAECRGELLDPDGSETCSVRSEQSPSDQFHAGAVDLGVEHCAAPDNTRSTSLPDGGMSKRRYHAQQRTKNRKRLRKSLAQTVSAWEQAPETTLQSTRCRVMKDAQPIIFDVALDSNDAGRHSTPRNDKTSVLDMSTSFSQSTTGFTGRRLTPSAIERQPHTLEMLLAQGFRLQSWDGRSPVLLLDNARRTFAVLAGKPKDEDSWQDVIKHVEGDICTLKDNYSPPRGKANRRGNYDWITCGISYGGGQTAPCNLSQHSRKNTVSVNTALNSPSIRRLSGFVNRAFQLFAPRTYEYYRHTLATLVHQNGDLTPPFTNSVFAACTFNVGPHVETVLHTDHLNLATGWCGIVALGNFNPKLGGHLVLWDLKLVIEFPPGSLIFIPSAILRHSNTSIGMHETRMSFTQYSAGGLFRWVECGNQSLKTFQASGQALPITGWQRWIEGLQRFSRLEELVAN